MRKVLLRDENGEYVWVHDDETAQEIEAIASRISTMQNRLEGVMRSIESIDMAVKHTAEIYRRTDAQSAMTFTHAIRAVLQALREGKTICTASEVPIHHIGGEKSYTLGPPFQTIIRPDGSRP